MKIVFLRQYRKRGTGNLSFVYKVNGTPEQLAAYKTSKGEHYREDKDTKDVLFFSGRFIGKTGKLMKTAKNDWVVDTTEADQMKSLIDQYGFDLAKEMVAKGAE